MRERIAYALLALSAWHGSLLAQDTANWRLADVRPATIEWEACSPSLVRASAFALGDRLSCGLMRVPRDHHHPEAGQIDVAIVRVAASEPGQRRGAIFFNPGGPGVNPMRMLPSMARYWDGAYSDHPVHGTKKRLAEQFDLIAVVPRGLEGGTVFKCASETPATDYKDILFDGSAGNVEAMRLYMKALAEACQANPLHPYINTEQTVYDMEAARLALGEARINYLGYSYGAWLGTWYAASYPERVGRMVLDSSMDWTVDWDTNVLRSKMALQAQFERSVGEPAANDRFRYGLGADVASVVARLGQINYAVSLAWNGEWKSPESLIAALTLSDWLRNAPDMTLETLSQRILAHRFHTNDAVDAAIRNEGGRRAWRVFVPPHEAAPIALSSNESLFATMMCNDQAHTGDVASHQSRIASIAQRYPATNGAGLQYHCIHWRGQQAMRPPLSRIGGVGDLLMVHSAHDPITPLQGAIDAAAATPAARLLVADGIGEHGVFGFTDTACIEDTVGRYLLNGTLPRENTTRCDAVSTPQSGAGFGFREAAQTAALRAELIEISAPFAR